MFCKHPLRDFGFVRTCLWWRCLRLFAGRLLLREEVYVHFVLGVADVVHYNAVRNYPKKSSSPLRNDCNVRIP